MMETIGNYEILKVIAEHGPTLICVARHKKLGRKTFLKIFKSADPQLLKRFEREARIVADLNDRHIVAIYDFGEENGRYFISMEYVDGSNLKEYLDTHELSAHEVLEFAYKITRAVAVLHGHGYIHRDLKPENILVSKDKEIKLTDFGIAFHESLQHVTTEGSLLGTPLYMSPEQINNLPVTPASDVFALGIIFYQLATKQHPFAAPRIGEIFSRILGKSVEDLCDLRPDLPDWFCRMVDKMLQKEPGKRYASAREVLTEFKTQSDGHLFPEIANGETQDNKIKFPYYLAGAVLFIVLLILGWKFTQHTGKPSPAALVDSLTFNQPLKSQKTDTSIALAQKDTMRPSKREVAQTTAINQEKNVGSSKPLPSNVQYVKVKIQTYPWCKIYLNYQLVDSTPMIRPLKLKPGGYIIGLQNPLYPSYTDSIYVPARKHVTLSFNLDSIFARLDLQVLPWGKVYIDGKYVGETPLQKPVYVTRSKHYVEIKNDFYVTWHDTLDLSGKSQLQKIIALKPRTRSD